MEKEIIKAEDLKKHSEDRHIHSRRNSTNLLFFFPLTSVIFQIRKYCIFHTLVKYLPT